MQELPWDDEEEEDDMEEVVCDYDVWGALPAHQFLRFVNADDGVQFHMMERSGSCIEGLSDFFEHVSKGEIWTLLAAALGTTLCLYAWPLLPLPPHSLQTPHFSSFSPHRTR
jgi:hypothetical protein